MNLSRQITLIAVTFAGLASSLAVMVFAMSRSDHDMKLLALGAVISQISALMSTASTMIVGKPADKLHDPNELPPGSLVTDKSTVQTPPVTTPKTT